MGCASSKQPKPPKCKHCQTPYSPIRRSYSVHVHHPPSITGDSYHIVALQSSTLGSLRLDEYDALSSTIKRTITHQHNNNNDYFPDNDDDDEVSTITDKRGEFELGMIEAKKWSQMIDEKITKVIVPKTPIRTPPGEPEMIDAWEMMNGLEDTSPLLRPGGGEHVRSFSFHVCPSDFELESPRSVTARRSEEEEEEEENENEKVSDSIWIGSNVIDKDGGKLISKNLVSEFDPEIVTAFRKALQELSPKHPLHFNRNGAVEDMLRYSDQGKNMMNGITRFHDPDENQAILNGYGGVADNNELEAGYSEHDDENEDPSSKQQQVKNNNSLKLVLYFTSLRGVRRTYENCCSVRLILKSIGVRVDDRDVSMHSVFKEELVELMSKVEVNRSTTTTTTSGLGLPQVFLGEKYIGGADEIRKLHEDGELEKILSCCERMKDDEVSGGGFSCDGCGDIRFVPCETCCGSCKIYYEEDNEVKDEDEDEDEDEVEVEVEDEEVVNKCDEEEEEEEEEENSGESGFQRCPDCNENGLIRCPFCCN